MIKNRDKFNCLIKELEKKFTDAENNREYLELQINVSFKDGYLQNRIRIMPMQYLEIGVKVENLS
jgi:hypothetical protein